MTFEKFLFYVFSTVLVVTAVLVVTRRNPVHAALLLVLAFVNAAGLWLLLEAEFLALALILVYVGAVMVLFLFVVMMLDIDIAALRGRFTRYAPVGLVVLLLMMAELIMVVGPRYFGSEHFAPPPAKTADYSNVEAIGRLLYTHYVYHFEIAAVVLLLAIIAAISLTLRRRSGLKTQVIEEQLAVRAERQVKLVKMAADEEGG